MSPEGTSIAEALAELARADPDRPSVTDEEATVTRLELDRRSNRLARAYQLLGVKPDTLVTIGLPNGIEFFEATLATWKLGATPQPVSARLPPAERRALIDLADPSLVVGVEPSDGMGRPSVPAGFEPDRDVTDTPLPPAVASAWKAPSSGGSTGRPKLIVATQAAVVEAIRPYARMFLIEPDGTELVTGPLYHNGPFMTAMCGLLTGNHQVVMPRFDAEKALALIERHRVDWMYAVPTMMNRIWKLPEAVRLGYDLSSLRVLFHMAAPCPAWLKQAFVDWLGPDRVWELYTGTEAQAATVIGGADWLTHPGSVGRPVVGEMRIERADGAPAEAGEVGQVWMRRGEGAEPTYHYIGAEAKARQGWECLGDLGWMDTDGYLYLSDRETDMILVGGANLYPAEVEAALDEHPAVRSSCVIGLPDDDLGNVVHALVQTDVDVDDDELRAHLAERLAPSKVPRTFERVNQSLRDDAGKVRRSALRAERLASRALPASAPVAPVEPVGPTGPETR